MWEDSKTGLKWVIVRRCYFPGDLPENIGHPCTEASEVYESNHDSTEMAGHIQGPCEVLPMSKFKEETERRSRLGLEENGGLHPVFLCKWLYDESKGLFQPVTG
ncbi:PHD finger protein [Quillaja saponaria]|uniref:PHD finger protein n=1 Tax=Quillaja saponaria TaxID=32244 RepID=A0AAD7PN80_QUISA|nr:PHD finger protein [Quillaja saponaria]